MKICKVVIENYQQFKHLELDFTHPETGEPLEQICFIGSNGTGKSTLLRSLYMTFFFGGRNEFAYSNLYVEFLIEKEYYVWFLENERHHLYSKANFDSIKNNGGELNPIDRGYANVYLEHDLKNLYQSLQGFLYNGKNLVGKVEAESDTNSYKQVFDVPKVSLNEALTNNNHATPEVQSIDQSTISDFWKRVIYHTAQRERARNEFENRPENLSKTKRQLIDEFDQANPKILDKLALLWNRILEKAGLEFDVKNAKLPVQLTDNLYAYIKLKATGERINYSQLSTGIRNFIFRVGHIYSLYFNREIENGFLFVDEPENSLFPDFLLDLLDIYKEITTDKNGQRNTQMFFATHNPIVAAQFQPYERIILEWTEAGDVVARRGTAPIGDDPNDVLIKDFEISSLMPQAGVAMWEKYLDLKRKLRTTTDDTQKEELVTEILEIGSEYNFPRDQPKP